MNKEKPEKNDSDWDLVVKPTTSVFDLNLKDIWRYKDLVMLFVRRDFVASYKQTVLGPLWHFIQPVFTTIMFLIVFSKIAGIPTDGIEPILFYMSGITIWNYFSSCLIGTSNTFLSNAGIFGKVYFPRLISPLSTVISNVVRFGIQLLLLVLVILYFVFFKGLSFHFTFSILFIIPLLMIMAGIGLGLGIIISALTTKYRDLNVLIGFGVQLLMYVTPVAYPVSFLLQKKHGWLINLNPLTPLVEFFRYAIFQQGTFSAINMTYSIGFMIVSLFVGLVIFKKVEGTFMDTV